jgi:teichuronic acid biosynthesis glycosyltransferase TuaH
MRILYLCNVRWDWIKQRPQFLAEGLAQNNEVDVFVEGSLHKIFKERRREKPIEGNGKITLNKYYGFPFGIIPLIGKIKMWKAVNAFFFRLQLPSFKQYDVIWLGSPVYYRQIKNKIRPNNKLVYDCMDDYAAFPKVVNNPGLKASIIKTENEVLERADVVFCSSQYLANVLKKRSARQKDIIVVNNAIQLPEMKEVKADDMPENVKEKYRIVAGMDSVLMYIGTVADWFDFALVENLLNDMPSVNLVVIGPLNTKNTLQHPRVHYLGSINRDYIFSFMNQADALIMPFIVNDLIESVNPVKLYEYIYSGKPSLAPYYSESEKFGDYVCLYKDYLELKESVEKILSNSYQSNSRQVIDSFIEANTWAGRVETIETYLL